jgi:hypothetical protein
VIAITSTHAFGLLGVLVLFILPALFVYRLAERKGRSGWVYLVASLLIGWPIPLIAALVIRRPRDPAA